MKSFPNLQIGRSPGVVKATIETIETVCLPVLDRLEFVWELTRLILTRVMGDFIEFADYISAFDNSTLTFVD